MRDVTHSITRGGDTGNFNKKSPHHCTGDTRTMWHCNNGLGWAPVNSLEGEDKNISKERHSLLCRNSGVSFRVADDPSGETGCSTNGIDSQLDVESNK